MPDYYDRLRETTVFDEQAMFNTSNVSLDQNGAPSRVRVMNVTPSFFRLLRHRRPRSAACSRTSEGEIGNEKKVLLSHALWQSAFGGDPQRDRQATCASTASRTRSSALCRAASSSCAPT